MNRFRKFFGLFIFLIPLFGTAQGNYSLSGSFADQGISGKVYLNYKNGEEKIRDSAEIRNGNFLISGKVVEPVKGLLVLKYKSPGSKLQNEWREIYLDNEQFSLRINGSLKKAAIENSAINTKWEEYKILESASRSELNKVIAELRNASKEQESDSAFIKLRKLKVSDANDQRENILRDYIFQNPDSYFSFLAMDQIAGPYMDAKKIEPIFEKLSHRLQDSPYGKRLKLGIVSALLTSIGKVAPEFRHQDINNKEVSLSQYRGKYVLLDFWASWCAPCRAENPNILKAYNEYKSKNFTVLGLSVDRQEDRDKWLKAVKVDKLPWTQIIDEEENSTADVYSIKSIPANYLINQEGVIIGKNLRGKQLHQVLSELLDKLDP